MGLGVAACGVGETLAMAMLTLISATMFRHPSFSHSRPGILKHTMSLLKLRWWFCCFVVFRWWGRFDFIQAVVPGAVFSIHASSSSKAAARGPLPADWEQEKRMTFPENLFREISRAISLCSIETLHDWLEMFWGFPTVPWDWMLVGCRILFGIIIEAHNRKVSWESRGIKGFEVRLRHPAFSKTWKSMCKALVEVNGVLAVSRTSHFDLCGGVKTL